MKITAENYQEMRSWFSRMFDITAETLPIGLVTPESHPVACLDRLADQSPSRARRGLAMAINDTIEHTAGLPPEMVQSVDDHLEREGLPSLTTTRIRFSKAIRRVDARGSIKNDVEYHAVRNAAELASDDAKALWELLSDYEVRTST